jgi:hypothetical protein
MARNATELEAMENPAAPLRPAAVCLALLCALEASEGRRKRRKRDQTPDAIGLGVKRRLLEQAVRDDPEPGDFEGWLLEYSEKIEDEPSSGAVTAMARVVFEEWRMAHATVEFKRWLDSGAPSEDAEKPAER